MDTGKIILGFGKMIKSLVVEIFTWLEAFISFVPGAWQCHAAIMVSEAPSRKQQGIY